MTAKLSLVKTTPPIRSRRMPMPRIPQRITADQIIRDLQTVELRVVECMLNHWNNPDLPEQVTNLLATGKAPERKADRAVIVLAAPSCVHLDPQLAEAMLLYEQGVSELLLRFEPLFAKFANRSNISSMQDAMQTARIGFYDAIRLFDPSRCKSTRLKSHLVTYAGFRIRRKFITLRNEEGRNTFDSGLDEPQHPTTVEDLEESVDAAKVKALIPVVMQKNTFSYQQLRALQHLFLTDGSSPSLYETSQSLGIDLRTVQGAVQRLAGYVRNELRLE